MKFPIKTTIVVLLIALGCAVWYCVHLRDAVENQVSKKSPIAEAAKEQIQTEAKVISQAVKKDGLQHTILKLAKEVDQSQLDKARADLLDTVAALNIERSKVKQVTVFNTSLVIQNQALQRKVGEFATTYSHKDGHFNIAVNIPKDSSKIATFDAGYDADLISAEYWKRRLLIFRDNYIDVYSNDLRFSEKGARVLTIKPTPSNTGASLQGQAEYNFRTKSIMIGPGLDLNLHRIKLRGKYLYDPSLNQWNGIVGAGYEIGGFN